MPSPYAHYRFGRQALRHIPPKSRELIFRFRKVFESGLQGPDFFFYYHPLNKNDIRALGMVFHKMTGTQFFTACVQALRKNPSAAARAYLYGVLGHYALDAHCHPYIEQHSWAGECDHVELEAEFDRHLLEADGELPPYRFDLSRFIHADRVTAEAAAMFFAPATPRQIREGLATFKTVQKCLSSPLHKPIRGVMHAARYGELTMHIKPNAHVAHLIPALCTHYDNALTAYPGLLRNLDDAIDNGVSLIGDFQKPFDIYK